MLIFSWIAGDHFEFSVFGTAALGKRVAKKLSNNHQIPPADFFVGSA